MIDPHYVTMGVSERRTMMAAIDTAIHAIAQRGVEAARARGGRSRFRCAIFYEDPSGLLCRCAVRAPSNHGIAVLSCSPERMRLDLHPSQRAAKTPLVRIDCVHPIGAERPVREAGSIVKVLTRWRALATAPMTEDAHELAYPHWMRIAALAGALAFENGAEAQRGHEVRLVLPSPYSRGRFEIRRTANGIPTDDPLKGFAGLLEPDGILMRAIVGTCPTTRVRPGRVRQPGDQPWRMEFDLSADLCVTVPIPDAFGALRAMAAGMTPLAMAA